MTFFQGQNEMGHNDIGHNINDMLPYQWPLFVTRWGASGRVRACAWNVSTVWVDLARRKLETD